MWNAQVKRKNRILNRLDIVVEYSKDEDLFEEVYSCTNEQSDTWLERMIRDKLRGLESLDEFEPKLEIDSKMYSLDQDKESLVIEDLESGETTSVNPDPVEPPPANP